jgi:hypothetical protein
VGGLAIGHASAGVLAVGQLALGKYVPAQLGIGEHVWDMRGASNEAKKFFKLLLWVR